MNQQLSADTLLAKLDAIFSDELDQPNIQLKMDDDQDSVKDWDSLAHIRIIAAVESEFEFQFDLEEIEELKTVGDICSAISARS